MERRGVNFFVAVTLLGLTVAFFEWSDRRPPEHLAKPLDTIGGEINGWQLDGAAPLDGDTLRVLHPSDYLSRSYRKNNQGLGLFIAFYAQQRAGGASALAEELLAGLGRGDLKSELVNAQVGGRSVQIASTPFRTPASD